MKRFFRAILQAIGTGTILIGILAGLITGYSSHYGSRQYDVELALGLLVFLFLVLAFGYLMLLFARDLTDRGTSRQKADSRVEKLGLVLVFFYLLTAVASLPRTGAIIVAIFSLLLFARIHRPWSSKGIHALGGYVTFAEIFDFVVGGTVYLVTTAIFSALSGSFVGGVSAGIGGGGKSGGGGASGRW